MLIFFLTRPKLVVFPDDAGNSWMTASACFVPLQTIVIEVVFGSDRHGRPKAVHIVLLICLGFQIFAGQGDTYIYVIKKFGLVYKKNASHASHWLPLPCNPGSAPRCTDAPIRINIGPSSHG